METADEKWICDALLGGWLETVKPQYNLLSSIAQALPLAGPETRTTPGPGTAIEDASISIIEAFGKKCKALEEIHTQVNDIKVLSGCARVYNCIYKKWPKAKDMMTRKQMARDAKKALTDKGVVVPEEVLKRLAL